MNISESRKGRGPVLVGEVVDTFFIKGRGRVLVIDVESSPAHVGPGDSVEIRWPEGRVLQTRLEDLEPGAFPVDTTIGLLLPGDLDSLENPRGAKLWRSP